MLDHDHVRQTAQHPKHRNPSKVVLLVFLWKLRVKTCFFTPRFMMDKSTKLLLSTRAKCLNPFHPFSSPATVSSVALIFGGWISRSETSFKWNGANPPGSIYLAGARKFARIRLVARAISNEKLWGINSSHLYVIDRKSWNNGINSSTLIGVDDHPLVYENMGS